MPNSCVESSLWPSGFLQGFKPRGYKNNIWREGLRKTVIDRMGVLMTCEFLVISSHKLPWGKANE